MKKRELPLKTGPWSETRVEDYLARTTTPFRLACIGAGGYPAIVPLWYLWEGGCFWCATHRNALLLNYLGDSSKIGFEVANNEPPYIGVRGMGEVECLPDKGAEILPRLVEKYLPATDNRFTRWLLSRSTEEVALKIYPHSLSVWDYRQRMLAGPEHV